MRVAHLTSVHKPFDTRIFQKQCKSLAKAGYQVFLVAPHSCSETVDNIEIVGIPRYSNRAKRMTLGMWTVFWCAYRLRANLYHFHDPELMPVGIALKLLTKARVVYDAHENYPNKFKGKTWIPVWLRKPASIAVAVAEQITVAIIDGVVTSLGSTLGARFPSQKTVVVENHALAELADTGKGQGRRLKGNTRLIYTGGLRDHVGSLQIVQALEYIKTPDVRLTILGPEMDSNEVRSIKKLPGFKKVDYLGLVDLETVYKHMGSAALGLMCLQPIFGYEDTSPNKLYEYMSMGLPIIASDFPLWKDDLDKCGIAVDATNPKKIAKAIDFLLENPDIRREMGKRGRRLFKKDFSWETEEAKLLDFYKRLLS